jgi:hypothetical protein
VFINFIPRLRSTRVGAPLLSLALIPWLSCAAGQPKPPTGICTNRTADCGLVASPRTGEVSSSGPTASGSAIKWHPGHYMLPFFGESWKSKQSARFSHYDEIAGDAEVEGAALYVMWKELEAKQGDYAAGIAYLKSELDYLKKLSVPKRLWVRMSPQSYGGDPAAICTTSGAYYPNYIIDMGGCARSSRQTVAALWKPEVADAYIGLIKALAAAFDGEPYFEGITLLRETAMGGSLDQGFSWDAYDQQVRRIASAARAAFKRTNVVMNVNFMGSQSRVNDFIAYMRSIGVGVGGPDVAPKCLDSDCKTYADPQEILAYNTVNGNSTGGGNKLGGIVPIAYSVEASELGYDSVGQKGGYTPAQIFDFANGYLEATHLFWVRNTSTGTTQQRWQTGILPLIDTKSLSHAACPKMYSGCTSN